MKKLSIVFISGLFAFGCNNAGRPVPENTNAVPQRTEKEQTVVAHSLENQTPAPDADTAAKSKWKQSGDPIDTKEFDTAIAAAEVALGKKPSDTETKKALSAAYFKRADA